MKKTALFAIIGIAILLSSVQATNVKPTPLPVLNTGCGRVGC